MILKKGFFDKYWNKSGKFTNRFLPKIVEGGRVVVDQATKLCWHQSGSKEHKNFQEAVTWIMHLNTIKYGGKSRWRLPTLEEALTLLEDRKKNGNLYVDVVFDSWQWCILTADHLDQGRSWVVAFSGRVDWFDSNVKIHYIRPVCSE